MRLLKHPERATPRVPRVQGRGEGKEWESHRPAAPHGLVCSFVPFTLQIRNLGLQEVNRLTLDNKAKFKKKKVKLKLELTVSGFTRQMFFKGKGCSHRLGAGGEGP